MVHTIESIAAALAAGHIAPADASRLLVEAVAAEHAARYPHGCPGGMCEACFARLGGVRITCPVCRREMPAVSGRILSHDAPTTGRAGYSRRHFAQFAGPCAGSGRRV